MDVFTRPDKSMPYTFQAIDRVSSYLFLINFLKVAPQSNYYLTKIVLTLKEATNRKPSKTDITPA